jgi:hypothetical protein
MDIQRPRGAYAPTPAGVIPVGGIIMWSGTVATIPANWQLCNGTNGTPDLRDRFIVGATSDDAGVAKTNLTGSLTQSGGAASHTHSVTSNVAVTDHAAHVHSGSADHANHTHSYSQVVNHLHTLATGTGATGNFAQVIGTVDNSSGGTGGTPTQTALGTLSGNPVGGVASGTTGNESATLTHGNTGNNTTTLSHSVTNNAVTSGNNSVQPPYFALAFIQRMS